MEFAANSGEKEIEDIKKWLIAQPPRDHLLFELGINSRLRISDILKMKFEDALTTLML